MRLEEFDEYLQRRMSSATARTYLAVLKRWISWMNGEVPSQKTAQRYLDYLEATKKAHNTVNTTANAIRRYFKWEDNPIKLDAPGIHTGEPEYLNMDEFNKVISVCETPLEKAIVIILFDTGCRVSEILNLELENIDRDNGLLTVTRKGGRVSQVNISEKGMVALSDWLDARKSRSGRVFMDYTYYDIWGIVREIGTRAGIKLHPHIFRHSRAVSMLKAGADPYIVQQHLGHRDIATTLNVYGQFTAKDLKEKIPSW